MARVRDIADAIEVIAPLFLAEDWDRVGLQVGDPAAHVQRVMLAVDPTLAVIHQAIAAGAQMLVSHHPLLFKPLTSLLTGVATAEAAMKLVRHGLAFYAAHTNLDRAASGTATALASLVGLEETCALGEGAAGLQGEMTGLGRLGRLVAPVAAEQFAAQVADVLGLSGCVVHGDPRRPLHWVACVPGSGGELLAEASSYGAEAFLTGEMKHHELLEAQFRGLTVLLAGHLATERPVLPLLKKQLQGLQPELEVLIADEPVTETYIAAHAGG